MPQVEVTNTCACQYCNTCKVWGWGEENGLCHDCKSELVPTDCYGDCYNDSKEEALRLVTEWSDSHKIDEWIIRGNNMGWTRASGNTEPIGGLEETFDALTLNGDYRLVFTLYNGDLSVTRYSHDEPTGASFTFLSE